MVRPLNSKDYENGKKYVEYAGLPTDSKPTENLITGSVFIEIDPTNHKIDSYFFDEVSGTWIKAGGE